MARRRRKRMAGTKISSRSRPSIEQTRASRVRPRRGGDIATVESPKPTVEVNESRAKRRKPKRAKHRKIRDAWMKRAYADGFVDYYSGGRAARRVYNPIFKALGKNTNIRFRSTNDQTKADILNFIGGGGNKIRRRAKIRSGRYKGESVNLTYTTQKHGTKKGAPKSKRYVRGLSTAVKYPGTLNTNVGKLKVVPNMFQTNTVGNVPSRKGGKKVTQWNKAGTAWHEVGHSMGLAGDTRLPRTDKSVMSYNPNRNRKLDAFDYKAINAFWAPHVKAYNRRNKKRR